MNIEKEEDQVIQTEKMTITLTTTQNQKSNINNNITMIDLGECENLIRNFYNLSLNDTLFIKKIDVKQEGMKIPKIEYDVYSKFSCNELTKLNLSICENTTISLSIPVSISESVDKLNTSSDYFNDICYISFSESGIDISLNDRKKEFIEGNKSVCQDDCLFSEFNFTIQKAKFDCKFKESSASIKGININKEKLFENFKNIKNLINFQILKCHDNLFNISYY